MNESFATLWEGVAAALPEQVAIRFGGASWTYAAFDARASRLAAAFRAAGAGPGSRVACCLYNSPAYLETMHAALKLRAVPVNVNYRYLADELTHLLADAEAEVLVFHASLAGRIEEVLGRLPALRLAVQVADEHRPPPPGAVDMEAIVRDAAPLEPIPRTGDDPILIYTGGTTGTPKGVEWTQAALFDASVVATYRAAGVAPPDSPEAVVAAAVALRDGGRRTISLVAVPLMHTTGLVSTMGTLLMGGTVVLAPGRSLDPAAVLRLVEEEAVTQLVIAGDAVARPLADEIRRAEAAGRPYDLSTLERMTSSGVAWSDDLKRFLLERHRMQLVELLAATEGGPFARAVTAGVEELPSRFEPLPGTIVLAEDGSVVTPGSDQVGVLAFAGPMPAGYRGDPERTAATYRWIDGRRFVIPGDHVTVAADGTIRFIGRGAAVVNTGGEKVYTKEVEDALLTHPGVVDCVVVGVPDRRLGEAVAALVQLGGDGATAEELSEHVGARLAGYKKPRHLLFVDAVRRGPNGKVELRWAREHAAAHVAR